MGLALNRESGESKEHLEDELGLLGKLQHGAGHGSWQTCEQNSTTLKGPHNDCGSMICI